VPPTARAQVHVYVYHSEDDKTDGNFGSESPPYLKQRSRN
jgi:hypothetical protein